MKAITVENGNLVLAELADPKPGTGEVLVEVRAAGLNGADLLQRAGRYPPPPYAPDILGLELAGAVVATGPAASRFKVGDKVMAIVGGGGQAELAVVHERTAMAVPEGLGWLEAGGFPEAFTTAHDALFTQCGLRAGDRLLVNGAAGGVGIAAVQLAVTSGAAVVASVRGPELRDAVADFGALAVDPSDVESHGPYDVVLELVGAPNFEADLTSLAIGGRIVVIGIGAGARSEIDLSVLMARRARIHGSTLRARPLEEKALTARSLEAHVVPLLARGAMRVPIAASFPLAEASAAYERFAAGSKLGKIVLEIPG